ncbi:dicarboxylate/amino acid:cation symporter [Rivularia sp. UHCC 0363]|uniref:dicarboxylate/amino acid:cation symporter n=1 Tax=Rivularia sp. UHCC 0363 TaxID=3110244 RepID=UPI002B20D082|nr:cation:dicarboxylase symporter family transporter [Rivularia sp. UHCC 0363]MEA5597360.1 cation:dicarboxylase symporter family transporter [Rivularia sp. UHCC 0363]
MFKSIRKAAVSNWLRSPWCLALSVALGIYLGTHHPVIAVALAPVGTLYLGLLKMCVLPILLTSITSSVGRLMMSQDAKQSIQRILLVFPLGLLGVSGLAVLIASIAAPGKNLSEATLQTLGVFVNQSGIDLEIALSGSVAAAKDADMSQFLLSMVPDNIFSALSEGQTLKVLVFSIVFGIALGTIREPVTERLFELLESIYKGCHRVIHWLTLGLPIGLCSLLADQLSRLGTDVLVSMLSFVVVAIFTFVLIYLLCVVIIWRQTSSSLTQIVFALKEPTVLALATSSSFACIPAAVSALSEGLAFDRKTTQLVAPLAITICRFGAVAYFALAALFVAQLYQKPLDLGQLSLIVCLSILAGMATSGTTGILTLTMLDLVLTPLKLPLEAVLVLFIAIDPIVDPFRTMGLIHSSLAATALIAKPRDCQVERLSFPAELQ